MINLSNVNKFIDVIIESVEYKGHTTNWLRLGDEVQYRRVNLPNS